MTLLFRDGKQQQYFRDIDLALINREKEILINLMEDFDFEERLSIIKEVMKADHIESNLKYFKLELEPHKSFFGYPVFENVNHYKS